MRKTEGRLTSKATKVIKRGEIRAIYSDSIFGTDSLLIVGGLEFKMNSPVVQIVKVETQKYLACTEDGSIIHF